MTILHITQKSLSSGKYPVELRLAAPGQPEQTAAADIEFNLTAKEQEDLRWYLEDYLAQDEAANEVRVRQVEGLMETRGEELYAKVLAVDMNTQAIWFAIRNRLADLRIQITTSVAGAAAIPWELMRDPKSDSAIALRVKSFVRVQSSSNISFIPVPPSDDGRIRLLYIVCRPQGSGDVELRAVANRLLQRLGPDRARFHITALRPPTFEQLQLTLTDAKEANRPFHIVHFDGHGTYDDPSSPTLSRWLSSFTPLLFGGEKKGKQGFLLFEHPTSDKKIRPINGQTLGRLLHDTGAPILVLNACQSAMHETTADTPAAGADVHDEIRAIGSLSQAVIDQGIPAVLGMRYSVYVVTAAQYIGELYSALAKGRGFGQAASEGRKHLQLNPDRPISLRPRSLQDWFVPVVHEAMPIQLFSGPAPIALGDQPELDPVQNNPALLRYVPEPAFTGRDETLLALDRAFDAHRVVLLHAYAGQGKTSTAVEFARWYAITGGLGERPIVHFSSFESHTELADLLNQIAQSFAPLLEAQGIHWSAINEPAKRRAIVFQLLRMIPVLWIWDNVEPVAGFPEGTESQWTTAEQADLRDFLKQLKLDTASKVKVLLTSRREEQGWLGGIPHRVKMLRMRRSDAANLVLSLGSEKNLGREQAAGWQPLLDYCDGNPLTLRVLVGQAFKMGLHGSTPISNFVEAIRDGEQAIEDADATQGRDKSLGASLDYGFKHAFQPDELPIIALLHLIQGTVDVDALHLMGRLNEHALPELKDTTKEHLTGLLERARETGLLKHVHTTYFAIHPALPWFLRQLFARHYDGQDGRSTDLAALRAWVEAVVKLGDYYHNQFGAGHHEIIRLVELEEANLLHARRLARRHRWWYPVIVAMQGLRVLYQYQGRTAEWSRLVEEIVPDYCTPDDEPIAGREDEYGLVMDYRVRLARGQERSPAKAVALQEKLVALHRQQAADLLALLPDAPLDDGQCHRLRSLGVSVEALGYILREAADAVCVACFQESIGIYHRIGDKAAEAVAEYNLGHAYMQIPGIRDLDAAEAAYRRSLDLREPRDALGRSRCTQQIGMVQHDRFRDARERQEPVETLLLHAQAAEEHYLEALQLCPEDAFTDLAPIHNGLGNLYQEVGQIDKAREHYEKAAQYFEKAGDRFNAGVTRSNMVLMYLQAAAREEQPAQKRNILYRARAYAEAALRDYQHYQGRVAEKEAKAQGLLDRIRQALSELPQ